MYWLVVAIYVFAQIQYWLVGLLPDWVKYVDDAGIVLLTFLLTTRLRRLGSVFALPTSGLVLLFIFVGLFSGGLNALPYSQIIKSVVPLVEYVPLYLALAVLDFREDRFVSLISIAIALTVLQSVIAIFQLWMYFPSEHTLDVVVGTFGRGSANVFGYYLLSQLLLLISLRSYYYDAFGSRVPFLIILSLIGFGFLISGSRFGLVILPIVAVVALNSESAGMNRKLRTGILAAGGIVLLIGAIQYLAGLELLGDTSLIFQGQMNAQWGRGRLSYAVATARYLSDSPTGILFGNGPGSLEQIEAGGSSSIASAVFLYTEGSGGIDPEVVKVAAEFGAAGLVIFVFILVSLGRTASHWGTVEVDPYWRAFSFWYRGLVAVMLLTSVVHPVWRLQYFAAYYWLFSGIVANRYEAYRMGYVA